MECPPSYRDYVAWLQQQDTSVTEAFWRERLKGFTSPTHLPGEVFERLLGEDEDYDSDRRQIQLDTHRIRTQLSATTTAALEALVGQKRLTLNTLVHGAWALLLSRYSGETDVVFGTTVSGRPRALKGVESMVGPFANTLPIRTQVFPKELLLPWLKKLQDQRIKLRRYEFTPPLKMQEWSEVPHGLPLFESNLLSVNPPGKYSLLRLSTSLDVHVVHFHAKISYPVNVMVGKLDEELSLAISVTVAQPGARCSMRIEI